MSTKVVTATAVNFSHVEYRYYPMTIGDNPSVENGVPITIDWNHFDSETIPIPSPQSVASTSNVPIDDDDAACCNADRSVETVVTSGLHPIIKSTVLSASSMNTTGGQEEEECSFVGGVRKIDPKERFRIATEYGHTLDDIFDATREAKLRGAELQKTATKQLRTSDRIISVVEPFEIFVETVSKKVRNKLHIWEKKQNKNNSQTNFDTADNKEEDNTQCTIAIDCDDDEDNNECI
jgi:hypothetical protein